MRSGVACRARSISCRPRSNSRPAQHDDCVIDTIATEIAIPVISRRHPHSPASSAVLQLALPPSSLSPAWLFWLLGIISCASAAEVPTASSSAPEAIVAKPCLPGGKGFLRARLSGAVQTELAWGNETDCSGAVRPTDGGIRMRFSGPVAAAKGKRKEPSGDEAKDTAREHIVLVFGIAGLREGQSAQSLAVNLTVIREGTGQFYSTQGDDKCTLDTVKQVPIAGIPRRSRSYSLVARGFCTEPARAVRGEGVILISRFDFAGRVDFDTEDNTEEPPTATARL